MDMNVEKTKEVRISGQPSPILITTCQKQLDNVEYLNYLGSLTTSDARCTYETKSRTAIAKSAFNEKQDLFNQQIGLVFKEVTNQMLQLEHRFFCCWKLKNFGTQIKYALKVLKCGAGERWTRALAPTKRKEELHIVKGKRISYIQ
jgi:hypothetical protein